jgi:hypothetical protein
MKRGCPGSPILSLKGCTWLYLYMVVFGMGTGIARYIGLLNPIPYFGQKK